MAREIIDNYPYYLKEFKEIQALAKSQQSIINNFKGHVVQMLDQLYLETYMAYDWVDVIGWDSTLLHSSVVKKFLQRYTVVTISEIKSILTCWIDEGDFDLVYNSEEMMFTLRTTLKEDKINKTKIREAIPCNMDIQYEIVEEL